MTQPIICLENIQKMSSFVRDTGNLFDPFTASQPPDAPDRFQNMVDIQAEVYPEGRQVQHQSGQISQRDCSHPLEHDIGHHQESGVATAPQNALGQNGVEIGRAHV